MMSNTSWREWVIKYKTPGYSLHTQCAVHISYKLQTNQNVNKSCVRLDLGNPAPVNIHGVRARARAPPPKAHIGFTSMPSHNPLRLYDILNDTSRSTIHTVLYGATYGL